MQTNPNCNSFRCYYNVNLDFDDQYSLIIYLTFGKKRNLLGAIIQDLVQDARNIIQDAEALLDIPFQEFDVFYKSITFFPEAFSDFIPSSQKKRKRLERFFKKIQTVKVFVVDENEGETFVSPFNSAIVSVVNPELTRLRFKKKRQKKSKLPQLIVPEIKIFKSNT